MKKNITVIVGARPNFIKATLLLNELSSFNVSLIHTGQHYDFQMSKKIFEDIMLREPDINLNVGSGTHGYQTGIMIMRIEEALNLTSPHIVVVIGDTNSALAGALAAAKIGVPIVHIESGERLFLKNMPEEINRKICDHLSTINCCATKVAVKHLTIEGLKQTAYFAGDVMLDLFLKYKRKTKAPMDKIPRSYILFTLHRAENVDNGLRLKKIINALERTELQIIWPIHPRSMKMIRNFKINIPKNFRIIKPVVYTEMLFLEKKSQVIITDSGGVQKEAYWSGVPCLTLMENTAWVQTLNGGWNRLANNDLSLIPKILEIKPVGSPNISLFGDGHASLKTARIIRNFLNES